MGKRNKSPEAGGPLSRWWSASTFGGGPGKTWTLWLSWILVGGMMVACGVIWLLPQDSGPSHEAKPAGPVPSATPKSTDGADPAPCPPHPVTDGTPDRAPDDISWRAQYGTTWPVSATAGPTRNVDGIDRCFQHSPQGAAMAAVNILQSTRTADIPTALQILDAQYVRNDGLSAAQQQLPTTYATQPPQARVWGRSVGYRVESFTANQAVVLLVESWPQRGQYTGFDVTLVWQHGDWAVQLAPDGSTSLNGQITVDPNGYIPWQRPLGAGGSQ